MAKFCRFCGRKLRTGTEKFCPGCGAALSNGNNQVDQNSGDQNIWGRQSGNSQGYWRPPKGSTPAAPNSQGQPVNAQDNQRQQPTNNAQDTWGQQPVNGQNDWRQQPVNGQDNRDFQMENGQENYRNHTENKQRNPRVRQINLQGYGNRQGRGSENTEQPQPETQNRGPQQVRNQQTVPEKTTKAPDQSEKRIGGVSGFYLFDFLTRMFRRSNIAVIIYLILNVALVCGFTVLCMPDNVALGIVLGIVFYLISVTIALSPIGEWYLRFQTHCKKLKRAEDINRLVPIFQEVYGKARQKDPSLNPNIQLYITEDDSPNAFATGRKTVCVTRGLMNMPDEQIRATLGHEFGHLAHKDTDLILLISVGNLFVNMLVTFFNIGLWFFDIFTTIMCLFMGGEDGFITHIFMLISRFFAVITVNLLLRIWTGLGTLLVMKSSRGNEFEADEFAFQLGYGDQLCALLDYFSTHEQKVSGLFAALVSSHPDSHDRIARLQQLGAGYYRP